MRVTRNLIIYVTNIRTEIRLIGIINGYNFIFCRCIENCGFNTYLLKQLHVEQLLSARERMCVCVCVYLEMTNKQFEIHNLDLFARQRIDFNAFICEILPNLMLDEFH